MHIKLKQVLSPQSSAGILSKAWYSINGKDYLVKGNSLTPRGTVGYEPYSEVMASIIADILGLNHVKYLLMPKEHFPEIEVFGDIKHVSICEDYSYQGYKRESSFYRHMLAHFGEEQRINKWVFEQLIPDDIYNLDRMIIFDAFIGNEDRHIRNIELARDLNGVLRLAPIFDNGASLLAMKKDKDLKLAYKEGKLDKSKPFSMTHHYQVRLVTKQVLQKVDLNYLYGVIMSKIEPILILLPEQRADAIKYFLRWRLKYLRVGMGESNA